MSLSISFSVCAQALALSFASLFVQTPASEFEELAGFQSALRNQIRNHMGNEKLSRGMGLPVEPGVYVTLTSNRMMIFDQYLVPMSGGRFQDPTVAVECQSGCPAVAYDEFQRAWLNLATESKAILVDFPQRVLFAVEANVPVKTFLETAYASAEIRPDRPPTMDLILNGGNAGLRARPFWLIPPTGLELSSDTNALGLTVHIHSLRSFSVAAASSQFQRKVEATSLDMLVAVLADVKKHFPSKDTIVVSAGDNVLMTDLVSTILAAEGSFPRAVFRGKQVLRVR